MTTKDRNQSNLGEILSRRKGKQVASSDGNPKRPTEDMDWGAWAAFAALVLAVYLIISSFQVAPY